MKARIRFVVPAVALLLVSFVLPVLADQPRMFEAREHLENAVKYLKRASADKGGHRERAIDLAGEAITAVNRGIEYDRTHYTPGRRRNSDFNEGSLTPMSAMPDQPNMVTARAYLVNAISNLNRASVDKGGYREEALRLAHAAVAEVDAGIEYDRTH